MTRCEQFIETNSADETRAAGAAFAQQLGSGDVVLLSGDLGAGKTQFTQGVAAGLGVGEVPTSPTFNIVISYDSGCLPLHHFDLYRLDSDEQLADIGLAEYLESDGVCLVEWAEKFPGTFSCEATYAVEIEKLSGDARAIRIVSLQSEAEPDILPMKKPNMFSESVSESVSGPQKNASINQDAQFVLAFDTANEIVAIGLAELDSATREVRELATREIEAHRASNTTLVPAIDALLSELGIPRSQIACLCVGRGPGSFTGVRICMSAAKGIASALGVPLVGVSTLDAIAWNAQAESVRGELSVVADAMRKEVYPVRYALFDDGVRRESADRVVKAQAYAEELAAEGLVAGECAAGSAVDLLIAGDGLVKYRDLFEPYGRVLSDKLWEVTGRGLLLAFQAAWQAGEIDPFDARRHNPAFVLPVYTRLSDAEENERIKLAQTGKKNLVAGVQDVTLDGGAAPDGGKGRATLHSQAQLTARANDAGVAYRPLSVEHVDAIVALESELMKSDAWNARMLASELGQRERTWWVAQRDGELLGYAGGLVSDGELQILKVAVEPDWRRCGLARELVCRVAADARNLGAAACSLEVRASNTGAQAFYETLGLRAIGTRPHYYSDGEDALVMQGPLPGEGRDVAGMELQHLCHSEHFPSTCYPDTTTYHPDTTTYHPDTTAYPPNTPTLHPDAPTRHPERSEGSRIRSARSAQHTFSASGGALSPVLKAPFILAIESSCDETAAAVVDGEGRLLSDVVASQIDFHARFGGVVPEIASRKHIEAICGVCAEALECAGLAWSDLDSVAVTYAPGLLGALVVGVAFAKGAAWALDVPFITVNHLEGHLYANKIGLSEAESFEPPAVVSLVSGGNTMLVHMRDWGDYVVLGETIDDAVGEAFDKVAKALGLGYPGGPVISREATQGRADAIDFPRAMLHSHDLRFSLSGLKTAVMNHISGERAAGRELNIPDIAASFQQAVIDVQVAKARTALEQTGAPTFCLGGGVAANPALRAAYETMCAEAGARLIMPPLSSCGDNAGMIALVALDRYRAGAFSALDADAQAHADF